MPDISLIITKYSRNKHWKKNFILFIWKSYKLNFNRVCSCDSDYNRSNIWKSELYINAEGQLFWNLKKFLVFGDSYVRKIDTLYLLKCELSFFITYSFNLIKFKSSNFEVGYRYYSHIDINIYIGLVIPEVCCFGDFCLRELLWTRIYRFQRLTLFGSFWKDRFPAQWETSHGIFHIALVPYHWKNF
jgi:hypothetical protein